MTRRDVLRGSLVLLSVGMTAPLLACQAPAAPTTAPPASKPAAPPPAATQAPAPAKAASPAPAPKAAAPAKAPAGRFVWATDPTPSRSPNPGSTGAPQGLQVYWPVFDALTVVDRSGRAQPALAKEWRAVDPTTWEFKLREDIKFHDGSPFDSADVAGTFDYYLNPDSRLAVRANFLAVKSIRAVDKTTVRFELQRPEPTFLKLVALALILPARLLQQKGPDEFFKQPVGTGPYRWISTDFANGLKYEAMPPDFVTPRGTARIKDLEIRIVPEFATRAAAVSTGEIDASYPHPPDSASDLKAAGLNVPIDPGTSCPRFVLDSTDGPTKDVRVRRALNYAVDKDAIIKNLLRGFAEPDGQFIGKEIFGYNPEVRPYPYDPNRAKQLLAEAGFPNGFRIPLTAPTVTVFSKEIVEAIGAYLSAVGVTAEINIIDTAVWLPLTRGKLEQRRGLVAQINNWDTSWEPNIVWQFYGSAFSFDEGRVWDNADFDRLYQAARVELDDTKRAELWRQAAKVLNDQAAALFLWRAAKPAVTGKNVTWQPGFFADSLIDKVSKT